jgi:hypothetical protein
MLGKQCSGFLQCSRKLSSYVLLRNEHPIVLVPEREDMKKGESIKKWLVSIDLVRYALKFLV